MVDVKGPVDVWSRWDIRPPEGRILHVFCEDGAWLVDGLGFGDVSSRVGVDVVQRNVQSARAYAAKRGVEAAFCLGSAEEVAFADRCFDWIFAPCVWELSERPEDACNELVRLLAIGGTLVLFSEEFYRWNASFLMGARGLSERRDLIRVQARRAWDGMSALWACSSDVQMESRTIVGCDGLVCMRGSL